MTSPDLCMSTKFQWPLWEVTDLVEKSLWPPPATTWIRPQVTSDSPQPQWTSTTLRLPDNWGTTFNLPRTWISPEDSPQSQAISNKTSNAPNGDTFSKTTSQRAKDPTDGTSTLRPSLQTYFLTIQAHCGTGQRPTGSSQERLFSPSQNTQDGFISTPTPSPCSKSAHNSTVSIKESVTSKATKTLKVNFHHNPDHWIYESDEPVNSYASRLTNFLRHYDGVHVLLKNREEVGSTFIPDLNLARVERDDFAGDKQPAHYYHNWRFNNPYWCFIWHGFWHFLVGFYQFNEMMNFLIFRWFNKGHANYLLINFDFSN